MAYRGTKAPGTPTVLPTMTKEALIGAGRRAATGPLGTAHDDADGARRFRKQPMGGCGGTSRDARSQGGKAVAKYKVTKNDGTDEEVEAGNYRDKAEWIEFYDGNPVTGETIILRLRASTVDRVEKLPDA
jgi:hypothetical protein